MRNTNPVRLSKNRALALLLAAQRGVTEWEDEARILADSRSQPEQLMAKAIDASITDARDAMDLIQRRYLTEPKAAPHPALFEPDGEVG